MGSYQNNMCSPPSLLSDSVPLCGHKLLLGEVDFEIISPLASYAQDRWQSRFLRSVRPHVGSGHFLEYVSHVLIEVGAMKRWIAEGSSGATSQR